MEENFTPKEIKAYLDDEITKWRKSHRDAQTSDQILTAACYVDAFQSVRNTLFGELLPFPQVVDG